MNTETQRADTYAGSREQTVSCPSCGAEMVQGMRFCRNCGFRLGEGLAEYVETVRLGAAPTMTPPVHAAATMSTRGGATNALAAAATRAVARPRGRSCGRGGMRWVGWVVLAMVISAASGGVSALRRGRGFSLPPGIRINIPVAQRSFIGVDDFDYVRGEGVMLEAVLPGTPAHFAGLRDGDLIQRFDGKTISSEEDMRDTLCRTPVGKTVEVAFTRDGATRTTMLKTVSPGDYDKQAFLPTDGSTGYWGVSSLERVAVPGGNAYGVRLGSVSANRPADIAGLRRGDIVVSFNGDPVRTKAGLSSYIDHATPGSTVSVGVVRDGQRTEVPVKMGRDD